MSENELKLCSYCKSVPQANTWTLYGITETRYFCPNPDCPHSVRTVTLEQWNTRPIEDELRARIAELEEQAWNLNLENARMEEAYWIIEDEFRARIAELEEQAWNLNLENERMEEAYWIDESIAPDGTSKPSVRKLLERLEKAETDLRLSDGLVKALDNRIAELEAAQRWIPDPESPNDTQTQTIVYGKESEECVNSLVL